MHDPKVVVYEIRRPWPKVSRSSPRAREPRWKFSLRSPFWNIAGREAYFPSLITIWHVEPGGDDVGTHCSYHDQWRHVHHWRLQFPPLQKWRRRLLTRCEECGRKGSPNVSFAWERASTPWWRGEKGLYHRECASLAGRSQGRWGDHAVPVRRLAQCLWQRVMRRAGLTGVL